jgi:hypothetical protein
MPYLPIGGDTPQSSSTSPLPSLSEQDELQNDRFAHRLRLIKARTESVAGRYQVGVYITGRSGTGKTYSVKATLDDLGANYQYVNCRVSPGGLYDKLKENPEDVIVVDDVATLFGNKQGLQVLQAALNGPPDEPRTITSRGRAAFKSFRQRLFADCFEQFSRSAVVARLRQRTVVGHPKKELRGHRFEV